jgi:hypothetical protein
VAVGTAVLGGLFSIVAPWASPVASLAAFLAVEMDRTDRWWTRITVGSGSGDGVVPYASQVYPGAIRNYRVPSQDAVSHTAEIDTEKSSRSIRRILEENVQVAPRAQ